MVKNKLGRKMAYYFFQGAAEQVLPGQPPPTLVEPKGAVPKKGDDEFRDISDAREGNKSISPWGTRLFTVRDLAFSLRWRAILHGFDISDGYHISVLPHLRARGLHRRTGVGLRHRGRQAGL